VYISETCHLILETEQHTI